MLSSSHPNAKACWTVSLCRHPTTDALPDSLPPSPLVFLTSPPPAPNGVPVRRGKQSKEEADADDKALVNSRDSGTVEIVVARLAVTTDAITTLSKASQKKHVPEEHDAPLSVALYYGQEARAGQKTWVLISKATCLPNRDENGAMAVSFREKAKRELSKFKAPNFQLPSGGDRRAHTT